MNLIVVAHCLLFDQNLNMTSNIVLHFFAIWIRLNACMRPHANNGSGGASGGDRAACRRGFLKSFGVGHRLLSEFLPIVQPALSGDEIFHASISGRLVDRLHSDAASAAARSIVRQRGRV